MLYSAFELAHLAEILGGLPVLGCGPGSPAARAGLRYGDVVLAVNGRATPTWGAFAEARSLRDDAITLELFRDGEYLTAIIELVEPVVTPHSRILVELLAGCVIPRPLAN